jgi:hypothetical protein
MPDIQSELSKVISAWETPAAPAPTGRKFFTATNNVTRATFDYVKAHPGLTRIDVANALDSQGYKKSSTTSILGQMLKQGLMRTEGGGLFTTQSQYTPLKTSKLAAVRKATAHPKRKYVRKNAAAKAAAYEAHENYNPTALGNQPTEFNAEEFVNSLTLKQAKAVFEELKKVFG